MSLAVTLMTILRPNLFTGFFATTFFLALAMMRSFPDDDFKCYTKQRNVEGAMDCVIEHHDAKHPRPAAVVIPPYPWSVVGVGINTSAESHCRPYLMNAKLMLASARKK
jgi:hypothetical protein